MLYTVHTVAASLAKMPFLAISKEGCKELAAAALEVTELYEVELVNEKALAWLNLAGVAAKVYVFNGKATATSEGPQRVRVVSDPIPMPSFMAGGRAN